MLASKYNLTKTVQIHTMLAMLQQLMITILLVNKQQRTIPGKSYRSCINKLFRY